MLMSPMQDGTGQSTSEDRATQLLICEPLSFANTSHVLPEISALFWGSLKFHHYI